MDKNMVARITNEQAPDEDGILFDTVQDAESALGHMILDYERRGFVVTSSISDTSGIRKVIVVDRSRRPWGTYLVEEKSTNS